ncbi:MULTISPECIES: hypothetical protein [unclassified Mesorhizobium]|uniref:hypothetical protein n=1 Tax=unclassified Mesorhizobium TaxID=325217 RepID=UPI001FDFAD66|nr:MULTISPECIES: hypothetical protein [unclassified Mesorhizobium]
MFLRQIGEALALSKAFDQDDVPIDGRAEPITRVRQIIERADRHVGGIVTKADPSKASPRSDFMVDYPYVWGTAEKHRLGSVTPHHFFTELERAGSLERLVDKMNRLPSRARTRRELARLVLAEERGESPWPPMKRSGFVIVQPSSPHRRSGPCPSVPARLGTGPSVIG